MIFFFHSLLFLLRFLELVVALKFLATDFIIITVFLCNIKLQKHTQLYV